MQSIVYTAMDIGNADLAFAKWRKFSMQQQEEEELPHRRKRKQKMLRDSVTDAEPRESRC